MGNVITKEVPVYLPSTWNDRVVVGKASVEAEGKVTIHFNESAAEVYRLLSEDWLIGITLDFLEASPVGLRMEKSNE